MINTPHINANDGDFAKTVLMPGDPKRADFIAKAYLTDVKQVNSVRNMNAYTGMYNGKAITVMGSGMGIPSIGIYSYELFSFCQVENIIRIGTCGRIDKSLKGFDIVASMSASYDSNFVSQYKLPGTYSTCADYSLLKKADEAAAKLKIPLHIGPTLTCDSFYDEPFVAKAYEKMNTLCVEMEAAGLYMVAKQFNKRALALMTIVDKVDDLEAATAVEREISLIEMIEIALETANSI